MGLFTKKAPQAVTLADAHKWLGQHGTATPFREYADRFKCADIDLPETGEGYYLGYLTIRKASVGVTVDGKDRGYLLEQQLPYVVPTFERSGGQPVRCVVSYVGDGWNAYAT